MTQRGRGRPVTRPPPPRSPIDRARDVIAGRIEAEFPDWKVAHGLYGWLAIRPGDGLVIEATSAPSLAALLRIADGG